MVLKCSCLGGEAVCHSLKCVTLLYLSIVSNSSRSECGGMGRGMSTRTLFFADASVEIVSQFTADAFGEVSRLEKVEVNPIQLGNSGDLKLLSRSG